MYWVAHYNDGSQLSQLKPDGSRNNYNDIDRQNLNAFVLCRDNGSVLAAVDFSPDNLIDPDIGPKRLIWRKRHSANSNGQQLHIQLAGWQRRVKGRNIQSILYINEETEAIVLGGQWLENAPMMHSIVPLECETDLI